MVVVIKKGSSQAEIDAAFEKLAKHGQKAKKPFDAKKYAGKMKRGYDGLEFQKAARDEWE